MRGALRVFAQSGIAGLQCLEIAREAGVSMSTVYARFDGKEGVARAVLEQCNRDLDGELAKVGIFKATPWRERMSNALQMFWSCAVDSASAVGVLVFHWHGLCGDEHPCGGPMPETFIQLAEQAGGEFPRLRAAWVWGILSETLREMLAGHLPAEPELAERTIQACLSLSEPVCIPPAGEVRAPAMDIVRARIRDVPDFPKKGILFKDITPVLEDPEAFSAVISAMVERWRGERIQKIVAIESRGFIFGAPLAQALRAGFVIARKPGKLPYKTLRESYGLEYGTDALEMHADAIKVGERVLIVDDLLATGGTAEAAAKLVERQAGVLVGYAFVIELAFLNGAARLGADKIHALLRYA